MRRVAFSIILAAIIMQLPLRSLAAISSSNEENESAAGLEEVVVTARRDAERLQDVPATVSVLTANQITRTGVIKMAEVVDLTPGVSISTGNTENGDTQINIRGLNSARDAENNVALVIDGILETNTSQLNEVRSDLKQIEVLKGPQGAYYGRNAAAGAIVMTTTKPTPGDALTGSSTVGGGENNLYYFRGLLSGTLLDQLGGALHADFRSTDGYYRNTGPLPSTQGATVDASKQWTVGMRLVYDVSTDFELDMKAQIGKTSGSALGYDVVFDLPQFASGLGNPLFNGNVNTHNFVFNGDVYPNNRQRTIETSIKGTYDLDWAKLTAWTSYADVVSNLAADGSGSGRFNDVTSCKESVASLYAAGYQPPPPQMMGPTPETSLLGPFSATTCDGYQFTQRDERDVSAEIRLASTSGPLHWSVGTYYLNIARHYGLSINEDLGLGTTRQVYNPPDSIAPTFILFNDFYETDVYAGFGSVDWKASERTTLSAALRYDQENRHVRSAVPDVANPVTGEPINPGLEFGPLVPKERAFGQWEPKFSVAYRPTSQLSLYANWGIGFKSGGFNPQGTAALIRNYIDVPLNTNLDIGDDYKKEVSYAIEAGFKSQIFDGKLSVEGAYYHTDVHNMQFFEVVTGGFGLVRTVSNIDRVRIDGGELTGYASILQGWRVFAGGNYTASDILKNSARPDTVGNKSPYTPAFTANAGTDASLSLTDSLNLFGRIDVRVTGPTWFHTVQNQSVRTLLDLAYPGLGVANYSGTRRDTFTIVNFRTGIESRRWSATLFATNVFDKEIVEDVAPAPEFGASFIGPGARRTIGAEVSYKF